MYTVGNSSQVDDQIDALPPEALAPFAEARVSLEISPWSGLPYMASNPDGPMRMRTFGPDGAGGILYLILEQQRRVEIIGITWLG